MRRPFLLLAAALTTLPAAAQSGLWLETNGVQTPAQVRSAADAEARRFGGQAAALTADARRVWARAFRKGRRTDAANLPFSLPTTIRLTQPSRNVSNGAQPLIAPADIQLDFADTGARAFPTDYRNLLQETFNQAKATMNAIFGMPALGGTVLVSNFDADIGDRDAVAGGYYLPDNGAGQREIRFPIYTQGEAAAVNFVHCLLLAYQGTTPYAFDGFEEGIVRAATMRICRAAGAMPATLAKDLIEQALINTYDVGSYYDWFNQRALGGPLFIAPNLRDSPLPAGGSVGGLYLLRYQMAGSAWQKALVENPGFLAEFNTRFYAQPSAANNFEQLKSIGQAALDAAKGQTNAKLEGLSFADWAIRQHIISPVTTLGQKLLVQPVPLFADAGTSDFGVFDVAAHSFETLPGGNESLSSSSTSPIFWDPDFNRIFPSAQDETLSIAGGYGSVTPNFPQFFGTQPYRTTIDIPVGNRIARAVVPAGAISTGDNPTGFTCFGTVSGIPAGATAIVRVHYGSESAQTGVTHGAFRLNPPTSVVNFLASQRLRIEVIRQETSGNTVLMTRFVNKGPGVLGLDLRIGGDINYKLPGGLPKGLSAFGLPVDPHEASVPSMLQLPENQVLLASYDPVRATYSLFPDTGAIRQGTAFFARMPSALVWTVPGRALLGLRGAVALRPGWNLIANPLNEPVGVNRINIVKGTEFPKAYNLAVGNELGSEFFTWVPGANDPATGAPETGAWTAATNFEPGKAYFVRVLAPEGVTMVFAAAADFSGSSVDAPSQTGWRVKATATDFVQSANIVFGQSNTGTTSFDRREDSTSPPRLAGMGMSVGSNLYKDVRRWSLPDNFPVAFTNLAMGKKVRVDFARTRGTITFIKVHDPQLGITRRVELPGAYSFTPTGSGYRLEIIAGGKL